MGESFITYISKFSILNTMKPGILLKTSLSFSMIFIFFLLFIANPPALASARGDHVTDILGDPLIQGNPYYMISSFHYRGLKLHSFGSAASCPVDIGLAAPPAPIDDVHEYLGMTVNITVIGDHDDDDDEGPNKSYVYTGMPLGLAFSKKPECAGSSKWVGYRDLDGSWVGIGGPKDHPCSRLVDGNFMFQKEGEGFGETYAVMFCPNHHEHDDDDHNSQSQGCSNVGVSDDEEVDESNRLGLGVDRDQSTVDFVKLGDESNHRVKLYFDSYIKQVLGRKKSI